MLRLFVMSVALLGLVAMANQAEARGRRGGCGGGSCHSGGYSSGGCYGGSCYSGGYSSGGCYGGSCQVSNTPATSAPVVKKQAAPAAPVATVQSGYSSPNRYARWRSGGRRFR